MISYPTYSVEMQKKNVDVIRLGTVMKRDEVLQILQDIGVIGSPVKNKYTTYWADCSRNDFYYASKDNQIEVPYFKDEMPVILLGTNTGLNHYQLVNELFVEIAKKFPFALMFNIKNDISGWVDQDDERYPLKVKRARDVA